MPSGEYDSVKEYIKIKEELDNEQQVLETRFRRMGYSDFEAKISSDILLLRLEREKLLMEFG